MSCLKLKFQFKNLTHNFKSCSVVNADGSLLFSKDPHSPQLTTTRLVAFQIVKKYLAPQPADLFVLNDPENGGFQYSKLIFIAAISSNLFIIWDEDFGAIDFKIPPTPLYDKGVKNEFVWKALIDGSAFASELKKFVLLQKNKIDSLNKLRHIVEHLSQTKTQTNWLTSTREVFDILFHNKAQGSSESSFKIASNQQIKLKLTAEEKQNVKLYTLDLTNTNLATDIHTSSHVAESALIKSLVDFYELNEYFTQAILDKIKIILPPRSIVSKPHSTGLFNFEIQSICKQLCDHAFLLMNSPGRKPQINFDFVSFLNFQIKNQNNFYDNHIDKNCFKITYLEELLDQHKVSVTKMRRNENHNHIVMRVVDSNDLNLNIRNRYGFDTSPIKIKLNEHLLNYGSHNLKTNDILEIEWSS